MNLNGYLSRINYTESLEISHSCLRTLHRAHLFHIPFENLDIHLKKHIRLDDPIRIYHKIVEQQRGGFCYEQNGLFALMLRQTGFSVSLIEARVSRADGGFGVPFDHLALIVELDERWLVDVGFGDSFTEPLRLDNSEIQSQYGQHFRIQHDGRRGVYSRQKGDETWYDEYEFYLTPRHLIDFTPGCEYHQTSPQSSFTKKQICSLATATGRKTITPTSLIFTENGIRSEQAIKSEQEYQELLDQEFGIRLQR